MSIIAKPTPGSTLLTPTDHTLVLVENPIGKISQLLLQCGAVQFVEALAPVLLKKASQNVM